MPGHPLVTSLHPFQTLHRLRRERHGRESGGACSRKKSIIFNVTFWEFTVGGCIRVQETPIKALQNSDFISFVGIHHIFYWGFFLQIHIIKEIIRIKP